MTSSSAVTATATWKSSAHTSPEFPISFNSTPLSMSISSPQSRWSMSISSSPPRRKPCLDLDEDCPVFHGLFDYCRASAGGSISAAVKLNQHDADIAINWVGGMHRAKRDKACGFCYVNDIVLAILELLKRFKRVLYIDIGFHHGDALQEVFYDTDRVMSYDAFFPQNGLSPKNRRHKRHWGRRMKILFSKCTIKGWFKRRKFKQFIQTCYQQGYASLSARSNRSSVSFNVPIMVLGGGGYNIPNVVRCWCYETSIAVGQELDNNLPPNECMEYYEEKNKLHIRPKHMTNFNSQRKIAEIRNTLLTQLSQVIHASSVQFQDTPSPSQVAELAEADMDES